MTFFRSELKCLSVYDMKQCSVMKWIQIWVYCVLNSKMLILNFWESHEIQSNYFYPISLFRTTIIIALFNWDIRRILRFECVRTFSSKNSLHSNMCLNSRTTAWNTRIELSFVSIFSHNSLHRSQYNFSVFSFIVIGIQLHYYPTC